ncbi:MAG: response regulator [Bdellovibrionia bacterium]
MWETLSKTELVGNARILVAEDNPTNQKVIGRFLKRLGCKGTLVANGREAVNVFREGSYDIIFLDCQMPEMDGYEAAQKIREIEQTTGGTRIPIIALTAHAFAGDRELTKNAGMDDYLTKPMRLKQIEETIGFWLEGSSNVAKETDMPVTMKSEVINLEKIKDLEKLNSKDQPDIICELVECFFSYGVEKYQAVQQSLEMLEMKGIEKNSHALKSVCFNVGAKNLIEICEQMETSARNGDNIGLASIQKELILKLRKEFEAASTELRAIVLQRQEGVSIFKA